MRHLAATRLTICAYTAAVCACTYVCACAGSINDVPEQLPREELPPAQRTRPRLPPTLSTLQPRAAGERRTLPQAVLFVPDDLVLDASGRVPLWLHFQGGLRIAEENFVRMHRPGVLIASAITGLSSKFSTPYRDPAAFRALLAAGEAALREVTGHSSATLGDIGITFFSAGYGAVREILKDAEMFARIGALVSADSIYADVVAPHVRAPRMEQMADFVRFAQAAARGEKVFVVAHTEIRTPYATTAETAALLLASVAGERRTVTEVTERGVPITTRADVGGFHLYGFAEDTPGIHMDMLYAIPELVRHHVPP